MATDVNVYLNKLKNIKLTKEQQQTVVLVVVVIVAGVFGYFRYVLGPLNADITKYRKDLDKMKTEIQEARTINMEDYRQRLAKVQAGVQFLSRRLPPADSAVWKMQDLVRMSLEGNVWLEKFAVDRTPNLTSEYEGFRKSVAIVTLATDYHQLGAFLSRLSGEDNVYYVEDLQIREAGEDVKLAQNATITATMRLVTYAEIVK
jgi:Tfp pilus assembly protein PilO